MPDMIQIKMVGHVWKSQQNGAVYDPYGIAPCLISGAHAGAEPKIFEICYEGLPNDTEGRRS